MVAGRLNLMIPLETMIRIEKECDKRGINRAQFAKEAIHEKLKGIEEGTKENEISLMRDEIVELRKILMLILDKIVPKEKITD